MAKEGNLIKNICLQWIKFLLFNKIMVQTYFTYCADLILTLSNKLFIKAQGNVLFHRSSLLFVTYFTCTTPFACCQGRWGCAIDHLFQRLPQSRNQKDGVIVKVTLKRKAFIGIWRFMIPLPEAVLKRDIGKVAEAICRKTADVSEEERRLHRFVVMTVTDTKEPVTPEHIAHKLDMSLDRVKDVVEKLEEMKVFFYRYNSIGINWAYPVTAEDTVHKVAFTTGEQCNAA